MVVLRPCETAAVCILFDPAFRDDRFIRTANDTVIVSYQEHAQVVSTRIAFMSYSELTVGHWVMGQQIWVGHVGHGSIPRDSIFLIFISLLFIIS